ncbi:hypothetical protein M406DRAFT_74394 [Cryphonectria parasitica EP155]|uniref:P-loop containing nucleoside triphosphate hydrolase protein n=1 Tax=Cryphonectria parasitica (strain ATCC 38755 / EP155) TaxID=660469 RepID=A0A9P4XV96_CRYP1|nr:uncharacterized protein M406DRAFT_74394 [Cryphonectria parasitica EP155]KAF3761441.1 hypothetical protein M406DRAFT_74394 [Cryphonectria parasitica EP155]
MPNMNQDLWWSSSPSATGWSSQLHPLSELPDMPVPRPTEDIHIALLGAQDTGKTKLQLRYTLRQFVGVEGTQMACLLGGRKHVSLADGTDVHLVLHELLPFRGERRQRGGRGRTTDARLLEQVDAVMLIFDPSSRASFEWIVDGWAREDAVRLGNKQQVIYDDAVGQLADESRPAVMLDSFSKTLPTPPDDDAGGKYRADEVEKTVKHDSVMASQSTSRSSSIYSQTTPPVPVTTVDTQRELEVAYTLTKLTNPDDGDDNNTSSRDPTIPWSDSIPLQPHQVSELPVLVIATQADKLKDHGGPLERQVTAEEAQRLAHSLGPSGCGGDAYIEVSAKTGANIDEAYGLIVERVLAKRRERQEAAAAAAAATTNHAAGLGDVQAKEEGRHMGVAGVQKRTKAKRRSCVPPCWAERWRGVVAGLPSWRNVSGVLSRLFTTGGAGAGLGDVHVDVSRVEDVWWDKKTTVRSPRRIHLSRDNSGRLRSRYESELPLAPPRRGMSLERRHKRASTMLSARSIPHEPAKSNPPPPPPRRRPDAITKSTELERLEEARKDSLTIPPALLQMPTALERREQPAFLASPLRGPSNASAGGGLGRLARSSLALRRAARLMEAKPRFTMIDIPVVKNTDNTKCAVRGTTTVIQLPESPLSSHPLPPPLPQYAPRHFQTNKHRSGGRQVPLSHQNSHESTPRFLLEPAAAIVSWLDCLREIGNSLDIAMQ